MRRSRAGNFVQAHPAASREHRAARILAPAPIIDPVAVADVEFGRRTQPPDGELNEAREAGWKRWAELAGIDPPGQVSDDVSAATRGVTARSVVVLGPEPAKGAGSMEVVVQQHVDHDH
jgi:hypothetical protein